MSTQRDVKIISIFNNKGGVGKTTLTYHLAHALAAMGRRTLMVDLDPQCNLTIYSMELDRIQAIWGAEDPFIDLGFDDTRVKISESDFRKINSTTRTVHYILRPTEEGTGELPHLPPPEPLAANLDLVPGRLTLYQYEDRISSRWNDIYRGDPLAIRTVTRVRSMIKEYASERGYEIAIVDTSPSLGALNKIAISTVDGVIVPCFPDVFSLYGIRNIGRAFSDWASQFATVYNLLSPEKRKAFPPNFVKFLGFTIYNARKYAGVTPWNLAKAHYNFACQIPEYIQKFIPGSVLSEPSADVLREPIGKMAVMHSHNTLPAMAHKYHSPVWKVPSLGSQLDVEDRGTIVGNRKSYEDLEAKYKEFATAVLSRIQLVP